jgi:hypothetical protein
MKILKNKIENYLDVDPFILDRNVKKKKFLDIIKHQLKHHIKNCKDYRTWYKKNNFLHPNKIKRYDEIPFVPSAVFKNVELKSIKNKTKIITSSGSSGQSKSSIAIDDATSSLQKKCLGKILKSTIGHRRIFFIADAEPNEGFGQMLISARYAGMSGYLLASKERNYLFKLNDKNELVINQDIVKKLNSVIEKEPVVIIGYTYIIFDHLIRNKDIKLENSSCNKYTKLVHFGGWKKLHNNKVTKKKFNNEANIKFKIDKNNIMDIYGFSEQLGSIYVSEGLGGCKVSNFSHILIRDPKTLKVLEDGQVGFMQFLSVLPLSYPGISILNDDMGYVSKRTFNKNIEQIEFKVHSRLDRLELRGCGDTLPDHYYI